MTGLLEHIENAKGVKTQYEYYDNGLLYHVYIGESSTGSPYVKYVYDSQNRLIEIQLDVDYSYFIHYDDAGRMDQVQVNNLPLMSYSFMENEVNLINEYIFGNHDISEYTGSITTNSGNTTITYNLESIEIHTNYAGVDPSFGGFIVVEPGTTYTISGKFYQFPDRQSSIFLSIRENQAHPPTSGCRGVLRSIVREN
ncbi:MAG: hypothetical protein MZU97_17270 [Bacillus subtilis]|nr:hypothetical protein [Bacillus subtilis]